MVTKVLLSWLLRSRFYHGNQMFVTMVTKSWLSWLLVTKNRLPWLS